MASHIEGEKTYWRDGLETRTPKPEKRTALIGAITDTGCSRSPTTSLCGTKKNSRSPQRPWTSLFIVKTLPDAINWQNHDFTNVRAGQPSCGPDVDCRASSIHQCLISPSLGYGQSSGTCCGSGSLHCATTQE